MQPKVKICCISSIAEAQLAIKYGATAIGLVGNMPSGPGIISNHLIKEIRETTPESIESFLLTSETNAENVVRHYNQVHTTTIQMTDALEGKEYHIIKAALPNVKLVQVIHVVNEMALEEAIEIAPLVDAILLDSGNPNAAIRTLGGTGNTHNWAISTQIRNAIKKPLYIAGGLNANNVQEAIERIQPFGVDVCSGVRTNEKLDERKLEAFFKAVGC
jgi:phosphoribosylanthranilate isomerase